MSVIGKNTSGSIILIKRPRITEKSTDLASSEKHPVYVFEVAKEANKTEIKKAIKAKFGVTAVKVNIVNLPAKRVIVRGKRGTTASLKKALVYLKAGDKIE